MGSRGLEEKEEDNTTDVREKRETLPVPENVFPGTGNGCCLIS